MRVISLSVKAYGFATFLIRERQGGYEGILILNPFVAAPTQFLQLESVAAKTPFRGGHSDRPLSNQRGSSWVQAQPARLGSL